MNKNILRGSQDTNINNNNYSNNKNYFWPNKTILLLIILIIITIALVAGFVLFLLKNKNKANNQTNQPTVTEKKVDPGILPTINSTNPGGINSDDEIDNIKAETLSFDQFYKKINDNININYDKLELPLQIKTDVSNYYEISRKIDFSDININELNKNGFTIINNQLSEKDNFYDTYTTLIKQGIPQLVTSDFIIYYYQNMLKEVFADAKSSTFFNDIWLINKNFFDIADSRYKRTAAKAKIKNDPVLEGQRLEAAYFATTLELLRAKSDQINYTNNVDNNKFTSKEANIYNFTLPNYLNDDVSKEVALIYQSREKIKSPVFRYQKNYADFKIPYGLKNSKLKNFYLANKWVNSIFPLYYRDANCPDCLLDKNDWLINLVANNYIAKDFNDNQDLKNRWARVYKVLSFFSGLRKDLTYLQFHDALLNLYGKDYQIDKIFSVEKDLDNAMVNAIKIQSEIEKKYSFSEIEGGYDRNNIATKAQVGMRLLQEDYWPDNYILNQLVKPKVGDYKKNIKITALPKTNVTVCPTPFKSTYYYRCRIIALDIINLYSPVLNNQYFNENTFYYNYPEQSKKIVDQLKNFTAGSWHNSNYWSIMYLNQQSLLNQNGQTGPVNTSNEAWRQKNINTALSAWINLQLPSDNLESILGQINNFNMDSGSEIFVEPNLALINELLANIQMLSQMFNELKMTTDINTATKKLNDALSDLNVIKSFEVKEMQGEDLDSDSQRAIQSIVKLYTLPKSETKNIIFDFKFDHDKKTRVTESINGVKLQVVVYQQKNKKILVIGPIFNYTEK